jgi:ribulose-phosphate 3-epimerase
MRSWPKDVRVAPSILSSDFGRVREQVSEVMQAGARVIHVDVMDGHFVPVITFGPKMLADVADVIHDHGGLADVHLMIEQPERHLSQFAEAGADSITVHVETCPHLHYTLQMIHELGCRAGVTLNPGTPVEAISEAARYADVLLCMSVNPGWGGQKFIPATLDRLPRMRAMASAREGVAVEVDGGIHAQTIAAAHRAGANILVAGSAIFGAASPADAYCELTDLVAVAGPIASS